MDDDKTKNSRIHGIPPSLATTLTRQTVEVICAMDFMTYTT
jgi:hypothetical protein